MAAGREMMQLPEVQKTWTVGTILASITSLLSLLSFIGATVWFAAQLDAATKGIPDILSKQAETTERQNKQAQEIAVLQNQQHYTDVRYAEIMAQLAEINAKLDRQGEKLYERNSVH